MLSAQSIVTRESDAVAVTAVGAPGAVVSTGPAATTVTAPVMPECSVHLYVKRPVVLKVLTNVPVV